MDKYVVLREVTPELIQDSMNLYSEKGYALSQFVVESQPCRMYIAVMEFQGKERGVDFRIEPVVSHGRSG